MAIKTSFAAACLAFGVAAPASAAVLDFESFANGDIISSVAFGGVTATISTSEGDGTVRAFDTALSVNIPNDPDLVGTAYGGDLEKNDAGIALIIQEAGSAIPDDNASGGTITFTFSSAVDFLAFDLLDDATATVSSPDLESLFYSVDEDGGFMTVSGDPLFSGITELTFSFAQSGAIDNLIVTPTAAVPLPAALPMLMAGLGGLALMGRRKRA